MNNFWYIELDGVIVPTPYQSYHQAEAARREMVSKMVVAINRGLYYMMKVVRTNFSSDFIQTLY